MLHILRGVLLLRVLIYLLHILDNLQHKRRSHAWNLSLGGLESLL